MNNATEERLKAIISGTRAGTWEWQPESGELVINARWSEMLGYAPGELAPYSFETWANLTHPDDRAQMMEQFDLLISGERTYLDSVIRMRHKDGDWRWLHSRGMQITETDGRHWIVGTHIDVTREYTIQHQLIQLAASLPGIIYTLTMTPEGIKRFTYVSSSIEGLLGVTPAEALADVTCLFARILPDDRPKAMAAIQASFESLSQLKCDCRMHTADGIRWFQSIAQPERDHNGNVTWQGILLDINEQKQLEQALERLTITDELTGLPNRRHLFQKLEELLATSARYGQAFAIVSLDIDHFKYINDTYGHLTGDRVLRTFATLLSTRLRQTDLAARMGGEEFMLLLSNTTAADALILANALRETLAGLVFQSDQGQAFTVTVSVGIATGHASSAPVRELLAHCDQALYSAKRNGRNQCVLFDATTPVHLLES